MNQLELIQSKIYEIRGQRVMLDFDLAELYQVETRVLNQAVKRNIDRFPEDFMFRLTKEECLRSQIVILNMEQGKHLKYMPNAFTEMGVAMLSSVLRSQTAIDVNIAIMRAFVLMRQIVIGYEELLKRIEELEVSTDAQFSEVYKALTQLLSKQEQDKGRRPIGYIQEANEET